MCFLWHSTYVLGRDFNVNRDQVTNTATQRKGKTEILAAKMKTSQQRQKPFQQTETTTPQAWAIHQRPSGVCRCYTNATCRILSMYAHSARRHVLIAVVSIVAVHGLGANPDYAWVWLPKNNPIDSHGYPDKCFNWLTELLPAKLSCRVLAFNYDSTWLSTDLAPQQRLSNISDNLLESLRNMRETVGVVASLAHGQPH